MHIKVGESSAIVIFDVCSRTDTQTGSYSRIPYPARGNYIYNKKKNKKLAAKRREMRTWRTVFAIVLILQGAPIKKQSRCKNAVF